MKNSSNSDPRSPTIQATPERTGHAEQAQARLAAIVTSSDDAILSKTLDGIITTSNAGARRIFGYEAEEIIGQPILHLIPSELYDEEEQILITIVRISKRRFLRRLRSSFSAKAFPVAQAN